MSKNIRSFQIADSSAICLDSCVVKTSVCNALSAGSIPELIFTCEQQVLGLEVYLVRT